VDILVEKYSRAKLTDAMIKEIKENLRHVDILVEKYS
jgi:hypothetical protein